MLQGKLTLGHIARVGLAQHGMTKSRNYLTCLECVYGILGHLLFGRLLGAQFFEHFKGPFDYLLVG